MQQKLTVAAVAVSGTNYSFDLEYSYAVPDELVSLLRPGMRVVVPFGRSNRHTIGLILSIRQQEPGEARLKKLISPADEKPLVSEEMLGVIRWLKEHTFCAFFDAYRCVVPPGFGYKFSVHYTAANVPLEPDALTKQELEILSFIKNAKTQREIDDQLDFSKRPALRKVVDSLIDKGYVEISDSIKRRVGDESVKMVRLSSSYTEGDEERGRKLTPKQRKVTELLKEFGCAGVKEIVYMTGCTTALITRMSKLGIVEEYRCEILRDAIGKLDEQKSPESIMLNEEQQRAYEGIMSLIDAGKPAGALLYGVTGSGKTAVFFRLIDSVLKRGKTALMLVPEISLTPQMLKKFKTYFGSTVAVIHSSLSLGQRSDEFKRISSGEARIVIGTRSAVFAPLDNIGIIIMDEEGEHTYKSESSPRFHARDVAINRCGYHKSVLLMASATPSLETYYDAKVRKRFHLFEMRKRFADAALPEVEIIDMAYEGGKLFSDKLLTKLRETLANKEQAILFLNRRGYTTYVSCLDCRKPVSCPNCELPLTYHKKNNKLMCHYCGFTMDNVTQCPSCGSDHLFASGTGTQRVEDELSKEFPEARILRMDADTTFSRYSYEESFKAFEQGDYDIMLGTQMIAKGLNFPNVTLVGVISLDKALFTGDFRSYERTFSLLTQVAGRSGRGDKPGTAYLQTFVPDHFVLNLAAQQDYDEFFEEEIALRKQLIYPPFCDICVVAFSAALESKAIEASNWFVRELAVRADKLRQTGVKLPMRALGPAPCTLGRINNRFRYRLILKCRSNADLRGLISGMLTDCYKHPEFREVSIYADINGDIGL